MRTTGDRWRGRKGEGIGGFDRVFSELRGSLIRVDWRIRGIGNI